MLTNERLYCPAALRLHGPTQPVGRVSVAATRHVF